tara:strand:- start:279 stop:581 length:303 start_codon:yes stop_codon:yes gene_type:complete
MIIKSKQNLGKKEITNSLKSTLGFSSNTLQKIIDDIIDVVIDILIKQKKVNIKNLGSLNIVYKNQRKGRNPKTKEEFDISSRNTIKFKPSSLLKLKINDI